MAKQETKMWLKVAGMVDCAIMYYHGCAGVWFTLKGWQPMEERWRVFERFSVGLGLS